MAFSGFRLHYDLHYNLIKLMIESDYRYESRSSGKLTLSHINKILKRWMNKQQKKDIEEESHFMIGDALELVFGELKDSFSSDEGDGHFEQLMRVYIDLFQCTGNNKYRFLVENHMKELLKSQNYQKFKISQQYYEYFCQIFDYFPYLVFRLLQSKYKLIFQESMQQVINLYAIFIKFANTRKNDKLIDQYIQEEVNSSRGSLHKLDILLLTYSHSQTKTIKENPLKQIIKIIIDYNSQADQQISGWQMDETKVQKFCETLFKISWPMPLESYKSRIALSVIKKWEGSEDEGIPPKKCINTIVNSISIDSFIQPQLQQTIKSKISEDTDDIENYTLNCEYVRILLGKFSKQQCEAMLTKSQYIDLVEKIINTEFNCEQKIKLLQVIRIKQIYQLSNEIEERIYQSIRQRLASKKHYFDERYPRKQEQCVDNLIFSLKAIRLYRFQHFDRVYNYFKKLILRDNKLMKQCNNQLKRQILQVCLHYCRFNEFSDVFEERAAFRDIIDFIGQQIVLKITMIEYIVEHLHQRFFNESEIYVIYRESKYQYLLYEDFATSDIVIKIFSIKTICYLAEDPQTQHRFFLKNAYNVIFDRLAIKGLLSSDQKRTSLQVIRQIIRYRGEMFEKESDELATLLIGELHRSIEFHSPQMNSVSGYILKIFQALMKKLPLKMMKYIPCLAQYAINILNFKIIKKELKKLAVQTFCEMAESCHYVILPYFQFPNLYEIIRQILLSDDHYYYYQTQMLCLIGRLGYVGRDEFIGLRVLSDAYTQAQDKSHFHVQDNFEKVFKETYFLRQYRKQCSLSKSTPRYTKMIIQDSFYNEEKVSKGSVEIDKYLQFILATVVNNVSLSIAEATLSKSLKTIQNLIPVLTNPKDQVFLHNLLFTRLFSIEEKYHNEVLSIFFLLLSYHNIEAHCNDVLRHYLKKVYNHKREDDIVKLICLTTEKYSHSIDKELVELIIVVKKIIFDSVEIGHEQEDKIKTCFNIIINIGSKIDRVLHLFFSDFNKLFSQSHEKYQDKHIQFSKEGISESILSSYIVFILQLTDRCPSLQYFLPSIRQFLILCFNREISKLRSRERSRNRTEYRAEGEGKLLKRVIDAMVCLMIKYGKQCESFIHLLHNNVKSNNIYHKLYSISESYLKKHSNLDYMQCAFKHQDLNKIWINDSKSMALVRNGEARSIYRPGDQNKIIKEFQSFCLNRNHTDQQDQLWLDNLSNQLFSNSNQDTLRACCQLAAYDKLFSYKLFEIPFYFFWKGLYKNVEEPIFIYQDFEQLTQVKPLYVPSEQVIKLTVKLKSILVRKDIALRIRQKFLDCVYFIERCQIPIMIKDKVLYDVAMDVEDSVKALFYLQREYEYDPQVYRQKLIQQYAEIGEKESAVGLFKTIKLAESPNKQNTIKLSQKLGPTVEFLEQLNTRTEKEKIEGGRRQKGQLNLLDLELKRDICDWQSISKMIKKENLKSTSSKSKFAHFAIEASINLGEWQEAKSWAPYLEDLEQQRKNQEIKIWLTMVKIVEKKYEQAEKKIRVIREDMNYKIRQMFSLSYDKSMRGVLVLQQVSELEEIVNYYKISENKQSQKKYSLKEATERKRMLIQLWNDRLEGFKNSLYSMQKMLTVRSLLLSKLEDFDNWIRFCKLALNQNQKYLARLTYAHLQKLGITDKNRSLQLLVISLEIDILEQIATNEEAFSTIQERIVTEKLIEDKNSLPLIFEIYEKYTRRVIEEDKFSAQNGSKFIKTLKSFPALKDYYELSHYMGLLNIKLLENLDSEDKKRSRQQRKQTINISIEDLEITKLRNEQNAEDKSFTQKKNQFMLSALKCFIKSVTFCPRQRQNKFFLEDCLKILNLISMGYNTARLIDELKANYVNIPKEGLIEIIPQLIARLDNQSPAFKELMKDIIVFIGREHPQTLLFPLIYMKRGYKSESKKQLAQELIGKISQGNDGKIGSLFGKAEEIVNEICKISLKLSEKVFIFMKKITKMVDDGKVSRKILAGKIIQFCENILSENEKLSSPSEFGFIQEQKSALVLTIQHLELYRQLEEESFFEEAINLIKEIKQRTKETLSSIRAIYLEEASNKLFKINKSEIFLFGTYTPHGKNIKIDSFKNEIQIIHSKQRPKKIIIIGSDHKEYNYLIKGKQDLRLDQRIMQLFTFINKMFHSPSDKESYSIQGYSITPISYEIAIIAWVQNCDTLGELIQSYRFANGVRVEHGKIESKLCRHIYPKYPEIEKYHKVEIYRQVIKQVSGLDLKNTFCKRSQTSEKWLKNRSCFIRSLAVMSIVGYIIGLGDRHPFNIMVQRDTWKVVHIDFGDCFQVNKMRKIFPEKVPFRLTRMLVNTMEACKTDGIFKHTCEKIMKILRMNKESILVIVEAFRYDPLFGWKITEKGDKEDEVRLEHMESEGIEAIMLDGQEEKQQTYVYLQRQGLQSTRHILKIIKNKLLGKESDKSEHGLTEAQQVDKLIKEAMSPLNLVQHFENWCIFW